MRSLIRPVIAALQLAVIAVILLSCVLYGVVYIARWLDDTTYHIPAAVRIAHSWNPYAVDSPVEAHWFPAGAETIVALLVAATGSLNITNLSGCLCVVALTALMYRFAGLWCRDPMPRLATIGCMCCIPLMIGQSLAFYVDIHMALVVCWSLYLQCAALMRRDPQYGYYGLAVAILAASVKYSGAYFLLILVPAAAWCVWRADPPRRPRRRAILLLAVVIVFTSGWYGRNWIQRGNPVFPFEAPAWTRPVLALASAAYESDPDHRNVSPRTAWPHPWIPRAWLQHDYKPDMTHDAFAASGVVAFTGTLLSLALWAYLPVRERNVWGFVVLVTAVLVATFPDHAQVPRYILFAPIVACLSPAVLASAVRGRRGQHAIAVLCGAICIFTFAYAYENLLAPGDEWTKLRVATSYVWPYRPNGLRQIDYAQSGHLRIGYTSGFGNSIALLYDPRLTNELIPLHYRNYPYNHGREFDSPEEFVAHVRALHLDYIHIFDEQYPGVALLRTNFPDRVMRRQ
jgi:hypothetical protein